ncbi:exodeoxyribonuclease I [Photobacterium kishitanii]|uniref:Exodeoxyribonuclease I n=1 Tax=Photobacterium kishitanii TaxID=318456 RepID=A0A2T3KMM7_9GAMM|nr:exodeoxyribonuclease I [Photobacterium kishitanii]PSV01049.1 exodeoxyribonuclease I [Photobacterium kishitanii]
MTTPERFVWFDYETFNISPFGGAASQFAAIVTDNDFNIVEKHNFFCKISDDTIPELGACLVTGINPCTLLDEADNVFCEFDFVTKINEIFQGGNNSCSVGYNSTKFDDEWTRVLLYRNLKDPYEWAYKNKNSRFDALNLVQMTYVFAPEVLNWEYVDAHNADGDIIGSRPSFRLEVLSSINGIVHENAHDALSDVIALINLVKIIKEKAPYVYDLAMQQRDKRRMQDIIAEDKTFLALGNRNRELGYATLATTLGYSPSSPSSKAYAWDLTIDPSPFLSLTDEQKEAMRGKFGDEFKKLGFSDGNGAFSVKVNAIPNVVEKSVYSDGSFSPSEQLVSKRASIKENLQLVRANKKVLLDLCIYLERQFDKIDDPDMDIYSGGFFSPLEKASAKEFNNCATWEERAVLSRAEKTPIRISRMGTRVISRNKPELLTEPERENWKRYKISRFTGSALNQPTSRDGQKYSINSLLVEIDETPAAEELTDLLLSIKGYASKCLLLAAE